jgi:hypothetical protein
MGQERLWQVRTEIQRTLVAEAIVRLHRNDWEGFTEYLSLQLAQAKNAEAFTLYHAKAVSADALLTAHAALRHGTRPGDLDRPRTERILAALPDFTTESDLPEALAMDAAANLHMAAQALRLGAFRHGSETRQATVLSIGQDDLGLRRYLAKATLTGYTERMNRAIDAARRPYHEVRTALAALAQPSWLDRVLPNETPRVPIGAFTARAHREALSHLIRQGLLVELYFGEHGAWPASLDDIAGDLGGNLPIDPFSGATYVYRPSDDGFQLYSVGENGGDDGGHTNSGQDDLVWRGSNDLRARD